MGSMAYDNLEREGLNWLKTQKLLGVTTHSTAGSVVQKFPRRAVFVMRKTSWITAIIG